jgi:hypothetical protein
MMLWGAAGGAAFGWLVGWCFVGMLLPPLLIIAAISVAVATLFFPD